MSKTIKKPQASPTVRPRPLTTQEVEEEYRIPVGTLRYWRHCNTGPRSYMVGGRIRYDVADLDAWIAAQKSSTGRGEAA